MSNGKDFSTLGKITALLNTTESVVPSGAERARACSPTPLLSHEILPSGA